MVHRDDGSSSSLCSCQGATAGGGKRKKSEPVARIELDASQDAAGKGEQPGRQRRKPLGVEASEEEKRLPWASTMSESRPQPHKNATVSGDNGEGVPPVPIPNTEVKPFSADGTWLDTARESRSSPDFISLNSSMAEHSAVNRRVVGSSPS